MQLKEFALISPSIEAKEVFQAIETVITSERIEQALEKSQGWEKRKRKLPASLADFSHYLFNWEMALFPSISKPYLSVHNCH